MAANLGFERSKPFPGEQNFQDGDPRDHPSLSSARGVGNLAGFQRPLFPHSHSSEVQEVPQVSPQGHLSVQSSSLWFSDGPVGIHQSGQRGEIDGSGTGYPDPPVPRRLVVESPVPGNLPTTYPDPLGPLSRVGLDGKHEEVTVSSATGLQLRRLPVRTEDRSGPSDPGLVVCSQGEITVPKEPEILFSPPVHVSDRPSDGDREAGLVGSPPHEAYPEAPEETLACTGKSGEDHSTTSITPPSSGLVVAREQCAAGTKLAPPSACSTNFYRRLKRRSGCSLRRLHSKRRLVRVGKSLAYKLPRAQSCASGPEDLRAPLHSPNCSDCNRQYDCGFLHQQGGRYEIRLSLCPPLETSFVVPSQANSAPGKAHSGPLECDSGQVVSTQSDHTDRVVPVSGGVQSVVLSVGPAPGRPVCDPVQPQTSEVCVSGSRSNILGSGCSEPSMGESGCVRLPSSLSSQPSTLESSRSRMPQDDSDGSGVAKHALVLGSGSLNLHAWLLESLSHSEARIL